MDKKRLLLGSAGALALLPAAAATLPLTRTLARPQARHFTNLIVETHEGRKLRFYDDLIRGRIILFNMMYTQCTQACPLNTAALLNIQKALGNRIGRDVFIYSMTIQPEFDNAAALRDYARKYKTGPGWEFLTGKKENIEVLRRRLGFYDTDPVEDAKPNNHAGVLRIGNDRYDRWFMMPIQARTALIVRAIDNIT